MQWALTRYSGVLVAAAIAVLREEGFVILVGSVAIGVLLEVADGAVQVTIRILVERQPMQLPG